MGVNYSAKVMVGLEKDVCVKRKVEKSKVKKFNEDTGEPYEITVSSSDKMSFGNKEIEDVDDVEFHLGFDLGYAGCDENDDVIVGKDIVDAEDLNYGGGSYEISPEDLAKVTEEVKGLFEKFGIDEEPKVYLVTSAG